MGRPRKKGAREPSGKLSRKISHVIERGREEMRTALEARVRHYGVKNEHAIDPRLESPVGRWYMRGELNKAQYEAAVLYHADAHSYSKACAGPKPSGAVDLNAIAGRQTADADLMHERDEKLAKRMSGAVAVIMGASLMHSEIGRAHV